MKRDGILVVLSLGLWLSCAAAPETEEGFIEANGVSLYYRTMGHGEPIVVLHGGPGFDHQQFLPYIWELSDRHKVILFDQRGTGLSSGPVDSASITIENFVQDVESIRAAFHIERMNLLGHSWGGILAMYYGISYPEKLKSLILCSTAASVESFNDMREAIARNRSPEDADTLEAIAASAEFQASDAEAIEQFWRIYFKAYFPDQSLAADLNLTFTENTLQNSNTVAGLILRSVGAFDLHEELQALDVPTLVLHGDSDPMPVEYAERIHQSMRNSELIIAEEAGHWLFVDATIQFRDAVTEFLVRVLGR